MAARANGVAGCTPRRRTAPSWTGRSSPLARLVPVLLAGLLMAGCGTEGPSIGDVPPNATLEIEGESFPLEVSGFCWRADANAPAACVDPIGLITSPPYGRVSPGAVVAVGGDLAAGGVPVVAAELWPAPSAPIEQAAGWEAWDPAPPRDPTRLDVGDVGVTLPDELEPGDYLLAIGVREDELGNTATYTAIVTVR